MDPIQIDLSEDGLAFAVEAIAKFSNIITSEESGASPVVFVRTADGKWSGTLVTAGTADDSPVTEADVEYGRDHLRVLRDDAEFTGRAVLVFDVRIRIEGNRTSALIAEIIEGRKRHVLAQRYTCVASRFVPIGRTIYMYGNARDADT